MAGEVEVEAQTAENEREVTPDVVSDAQQESEGPESASEEPDQDQEPARRRRGRRDDDELEPGRVGPAPEKAAQAAEVARLLVDKMGMAAVVSVEDEHEQIVVTLTDAEGSTDVGDMLGGSRPPAVPSFQFLLNKIVNRFPEDRKHIVVEAPIVAERLAERRAAQPARAPQEAPPPAPIRKDVPEGVDEELGRLAHWLADRANEIGRVITIHPMSAGDRRAMHQTLTGRPDAETLSDGDGLYRRFHVVPASLSTSAGGGEDGPKKRRRRRRRRGGRGDGGGEG